MKIAGLPKNEDLRLEDLLSYDILDSSREEDFDDLSLLAAQICNCEMAIISFIDKDRQWFKSAQSIGVSETSRDLSFCSHTILKQEVLVIPDARNDDRFNDNPFVTGEMNIVFYAGAPIVSSSGFNLGSVCVMDHQPKKTFSSEQIAALEAISRQVAKLLELRVKNKLILQKTRAIIQAEKKIAQLSMLEHEQDKNYIATQLHENFAQSLAAINLNIRFAEEAEELSGYFFRKCREQIIEVIEDIRSLSRSLVPTTFQNANYCQFIEEMALEFGRQHNIKVILTQEGNDWGCSQIVGMTLFRAVQMLLRNALDCEAKMINIIVETEGKIIVECIDNGLSLMNARAKRKDLLNNLIARIDMIHGYVTTGTDPMGNNLTSITIPPVMQGTINQSLPPFISYN